jgi:hypothetical protein
MVVSVFGWLLVCWDGCLDECGVFGWFICSPNVFLQN